MPERGLCKVLLIGRVGQDPEARYTQNGRAVASFTFATNRVWKDREGETRVHTEWHKITAFGKTAEFCLEYVNKGRQLYIEGRIETDEWQDQDGNQRKTTKIIAEQIQFLGSPDRDDRPRRDTSNERRESYSRPRQTGGTGHQPSQEEAPF